MPSKNMLPKGKRRQTVKPAYRLHRTALQDAQEAAESEPQVERPELHATVDAGPEADPAPPPEFEFEDGVRVMTVGEAGKGKRVDAFLTRALPEISRARVQLLIENGQVRLDGKAAKAGYKLEGGERIEVEGEPQPAPLRAEPEDIPLVTVYEDEDLVVIDKPAGMTVHAGSGDAEHNRGTLVNALLFHFGNQLSGEGGELRPGIVHRLDKDTSGLILVAKNDASHRRLAEMFSSRDLRKVYVALVHGTIAKDEGTINLPVGRDLVRRIRMTTKRSVESGARPAVSHWRVLDRIGTRDKPGPFGAYTLVEVTIETGRTHQIRVHLAAIGHPVAGDTLYGAPARLRSTRATDAEPEPTLPRNFLHAAELDLKHPRSGKKLELRSALPPELRLFLEKVTGDDRK